MKKLLLLLTAAAGLFCISVWAQSDDRPQGGYAGVSVTGQTGLYDDYLSVDRKDDYSSLDRKVGQKTKPEDSSRVRIGIIEP